MASKGGPVTSLDTSLWMENLAKYGIEPGEHICYRSIKEEQLVQEEMVQVSKGKL